MLRILYVEDNHQEQNLVKLSLPEYSFYTAATGKEGLGLLQEKDPDLVLLDIKLPDENGISILEKMMLFPKAPPIIMVSAMTQPQNIRESFKKGAADFIAKPFKAADLSQAIKQVMLNHPRIPDSAKSANSSDSSDLMEAAIPETSEPEASIIEPPHMTSNPQLPTSPKKTVSSPPQEKSMYKVQVSDDSLRNAPNNYKTPDDNQPSNISEAPAMKSTSTFEVYSSSGIYPPPDFSKYTTVKKNFPDNFRSNLPNDFRIDFEQQTQSGDENLPVLYGDSNPMVELDGIISRFALSDKPVLIVGESGTGKEISAKLIHLYSRRKDKPYRILHCGGVSDALIESELYGTEPGAFTGSTSKPGIFEQANGGSIFLDEVGEMPLLSQVKFLRILEEKSIFRMSGRRNIKINVRIIAATNRDLRKEVAVGRFRKDLYYRISNLPIYIPPLRERRSDIMLLAYHFIQDKNGLREIEIAAAKKLIAHSWPGNVRELKGVMDRASIFAGLNRIQSEQIQFLE